MHKKESMPAEEGMTNPYRKAALIFLFIAYLLLTDKQKAHQFTKFHMQYHILVVSFQVTLLSGQSQEFFFKVLK